MKGFLEWFGAERRGYYVVQNIRNALDKVGVRTEPDFEGVFIDSVISFVPVSLAPTLAVEGSPVTVAIADEQADTTAEASSGLLTDPTYRVKRLPSANHRPLSVHQDTPLAEAVTLMLSHDYSQLPVMQGDRELKGVISWESLGGRVALGRPCKVVRDCMEHATEISSEASLFAAIDSIIAHQYVLVRNSTNRICGIITTSDLSLQFQLLTEPFLLLGEIESHMRRLVQGKFTPAELATAKDPADKRREVGKAADLSFGEHVRLLDNAERWSRLGVEVDRGVIVGQLRRLQKIRNDVMHFDPDGIEPSDLEALRKFVRFMQELRSIGVT